MKKGEAIRFYHRYNRREETEVIYGERWLRWNYETASGRLFLRVIRRAVVSRLYGRLMDRRGSRRRIAPFIEQYGIDTAEMRQPPESYRSFNDFFYRRLKPEARPIAPGDKVAVFPADGRHLAYADLSRVGGFIAKGQRFDLEKFLGDAALAERYREGSALVSRLCPVDYHRYHFPCAGAPGESRLIDGWLHSVNPIALRRNVRYLIENKRAFCLMETERFGTVVFAEIGATFVGGIVNAYRPSAPVEKGAEKGYFRFGGSCVILLFERGRMRFDGDIIANSERFLETYARMGDRMGEAG